MAGKNQVILSFSGDSRSLERTFDRVGAGAKTMGRDTTKSFDKVADGSRKAARTAKGLQGALGGLVASGQGVRAIMEGDVLGGLLMLEGGFGRLFIGIAKLAQSFAVWVAQFVAGTARTVAAHVAAAARIVAGWVLMGVQALIAGAKMALAWIIGLGPVGLVIAGIAAVIGILAVLGVSFDDIKRIASGVFGWIKSNWPLLLAILTGPFGLAVLAIARNWETIKSGFTAVKDWISDRVDDIVGFFAGLPGRIASAFSALGGSIAEALVGALKIGWNAFANWANGIIPNSIGWGPASIDLPDNPIPTFHRGGVMPGAIGTEGLALLQAGERVIPAGRSGGGVTVINHFHIAGSIHAERDLVRVIRDEFARGGFSGVT